MPSFEKLYNDKKPMLNAVQRTDKKEKKIFLIYKEIQMAKSYMRKCFLIYEKMGKYLVIYGEAVSHKRLCNRFLLDFLILEENLVLFFISAQYSINKHIL
jgi:hypothetical protein